MPMPMLNPISEYFETVAKARHFSCSFRVPYCWLLVGGVHQTATCHKMFQMKYQYTHSLQRLTVEVRLTFIPQVVCVSIT